MLRRGSSRGGEPSAAAAATEEEKEAAAEGANRREHGGAAKELSALLLSAMLLGNPQLSDAAAVTQAVGGGGSPTVDPTVQGRLIADLEKRLMSIPTAGDSDASAAPPPAAAAAAAPAAAPQKVVAAAAAADVDAAPRIQPMFVPPTATSETATEAAPAAPAPAPAAPAPTPPALSSTKTSSGTGGGSSSGKNSKEPLITMRDYSFSIKLPELNLPPVAPITVPEEGSPFAGIQPGEVFRAPSGERVAPQPDLPGAGLVREALQGVARGEGVKDLAEALAAAAPKQADYNR